MSTPHRPRRARWILASALIGWVIGGWGYPGWQYAVEDAQGAAGLVRYGPSDPTGIIQGEAWTIVTQAAELGLRLGAGEKLLSRILSGFIGATVYSSITITVLALEAPPLMALAAPFILHLAGPDFNAFTYHIWLFGGPGGYGLIGLMLTFAAAGLMGMGRWGAGAFLAGLLLSIHPTHGAFLVLSLAASLVWDRSLIPGIQRKALLWGGAGLAVSVASLLLHLYRHAGPAAVVIPADPADYAGAFILHWDNHRRRFPPLSNVTPAVGMAVVLSLLAIHRPRGGGAQPTRFFLRFLAVSGVLAAMLSAFYWLPPENRFVRLVVTTIPSRFLNLGTLACPLLVLGLAGGDRKDWRSQAICATFILFVLLRLRPAYFMLTAALSAGLYGLVRFGATRPARLSVAADRAERAWGEGAHRWVSLGARASLVLLGVVAVSAAGWDTYAASGPNNASFQEIARDPALAAARGSQGLILTCSSISLIQVHTRRPMVLDGGRLNGLPYTPRAGPATARILREIYGIDLLDPPEEIRKSRAGQLVDDSGRRVFEARSPEQWAELAASFGFSQILCHSDWELRLPEAARSQGFVLYDVPPAEGAK